VSTKNAKKYDATSGTSATWAADRSILLFPERVIFAKWPFLHTKAACAQAGEPLGVARQRTLPKTQASGSGVAENPAPALQGRALPRT